MGVPEDESYAATSDVRFPGPKPITLATYGYPLIPRDSLNNGEHGMAPRLFEMVPGLVYLQGLPESARKVIRDVIVRNL